MKKEDKGVYVVKATAFKVKGQVISKPMLKRDADAFAQRLKDNMKEIEAEFRAFDDIKVTKYKPEPLYLNKSGENPYSILDDLNTRIK